MTFLAKDFVQWLGPDLRAELLAGQHQQYAGLHSLFREGLAAEAEEQALVKACLDVARGTRGMMD